MKKLAFALIFLILFSGCGTEPVYEEPTDTDCMPWSDISHQRPVIMVGGELYYYDEVFLIKFIPENYTALGNFSPTPDEMPKEELQMRCREELSGTVYAGDETNSTVYVAFDGEEKYCVRFVCSKMATNPNMVGHNSIIYYGGRLYEHNYSLGGESYADEVPEGFEPVGKLEYIGVNNIPQNDLETNCNMDNYSSGVDGREVYANPDDPSVVYVFNIGYWREGSYTNYLRCEAFEE